jgi:hypothetical protein
MRKYVGKRQQLARCVLNEAPWITLHFILPSYWCKSVAVLHVLVKVEASHLASRIQLRHFVMKTWNSGTTPHNFPYMSDSTNPSNITFSVMDSGY